MKTSKSFGLIFTLLLLFGCDFTSVIQKEVIEAQNHIVKQEYAKAVKKYEKVLKKRLDPTLKVKIFYQLGDLHSIYLQNYPKAILAYEQVVKNSKDPIWMVKSVERIANINFNLLKNYKQSYLGYKKLYEFRPKLKDSETYQYKMALSALKQKEFDYSISLFKEILKNGNHRYYLDAIYNIGLAYYQNKKWKKSVLFFKKYVNLENDIKKISFVKFLMGNAYETSENLKMAYNIYYSILGVYPNTKLIQGRLNSIYNRKLARKR